MKLKESNAVARAIRDSLSDSLSDAGRAHNLSVYSVARHVSGELERETHFDRINFLKLAGVPVSQLDGFNPEALEISY